MTHLTSEELFALYDGDVTNEARRAAETHLLTCGACARVLADWRHVAAAAFAPATPEPSEAFVQRVMQRLASSSRPPQWSWRPALGWVTPALGLAVLLVTLAGPLQQPASISALLLSEGHDAAALQPLLTGEHASEDDVLGLLMEEAS